MYVYGKLSVVMQVHFTNTATLINDKTKCHLFHTVIVTVQTSIMSVQYFPYTQPYMS